MAKNLLYRHTKKLFPFYFPLPFYIQCIGGKSQHKYTKFLITFPLLDEPFHRICFSFQVMLFVIAKPCIFRDGCHSGSWWVHILVRGQMKRSTPFKKKPFKITPDPWLELNVSETNHLCE